MGYPILYKAIPGLGHEGHPVADRLGIAFFDYALSLREEKRDHEESNAKGKGYDRSTQPPAVKLPWPATFKEPEFIGDVVNQQVFRAEEAAENVPEGFRVSIPTKKLADIWMSEK